MKIQSSGLLVLVNSGVGGSTKDLILLLLRGDPVGASLLFLAQRQN